MRHAAVVLALAIPQVAIADPTPEPPRRAFVAVGVGFGFFTGDDNEAASQAASLTTQVGIPLARGLHVLAGLDLLTLAHYERDPSRYQQNLVVFTGLRWTGSEDSSRPTKLSWYARGSIGFGHVSRHDYDPFGGDRESGPWGFALGGGLGYRLRSAFADTAMEIVDQVVFYDGGTRHAVGINLVFEPVRIGP